jgi:hypothetical protein
MPEAEDSSTFLKRYLALKALRENIFLNNPTGYGFLDIVEDIPGAGRGQTPCLALLLFLKILKLDENRSWKL